MNLLRAVTVCLFFLAVIPYSMGYLICNGKSTAFDNGIEYIFVMGFLAELSVWWVLCVPYVFFFREYPFHYLCNIFLVVTTLLTVYGMSIRIKKGVSIRTQAGERMITKSSMPYLLLFCCVSGVQFFRTIFIREYEFSDEMSYAALINDVVYIDKIFIKSSMSGEIGDGTIVIRRALGTWYFYLANLSYYSKLHASFLCKVLIPVVVLVMFYCVSYTIGKTFFRSEPEKQIIFMAAVACVMEVFWLPNIRFYMVTYPVMWGKTTMAITTVPLVLLYMQSVVSNEKMNDGLGIPLVLGCSAVNFTTGAFLYISIELVLILCGFFVVRRIKSKRLLLNCIICEVPLAVTMILYLLNKTGIIKG